MSMNSFRVWVTKHIIYSYIMYRMKMKTHELFDSQSLIITLEENFFIKINHTYQSLDTDSLIEPMEHGSFTKR